MGVCAEDDNDEIVLAGDLIDVFAVMVRKSAVFTCLRWRKKERKWVLWELLLGDIVTIGMCAEDNNE